ncbi:uncharacterized protein LOC123523710 [Mercenaria mercenaria]|uniref:uncharacterized protein LOC123523710 n=1 Tax=Mercenaria mercenaria TaxID=6596 RepID=UPI00234EFF0C|nr:uncharacterized protein LOC123523710 [Mercenaria mercenaria]
MESYIRGLQSLGLCQDSYGNLLVPVIIEKLPTEIIRNMTREHGSSNWQLPELRQALKKEINILESGQPTHSLECHNATASFFTGTRPNPTSTRKHQTTISERSKRLRCPFCDDHHFACDCKKVTQTLDRKNIVKKKQLCFNCLGSHRVAACRSNHRCRICSRKHHTSICDQQDKQTAPHRNLNVTAPSFTTAPTPAYTNMNAAAPGFTPVPTYVNRDNVISGSRGQSAILHSTTQSRPSVLLKTAVAKVTSDGNCTDANILFDEGAQRSFITEELADKLQLSRSGTEVVQLAAFGSSSMKVSHKNKATVYLLTDNKERIDIDVLIVPTIAVPLRNLHRTTSALPYLRGLKLAHPVTEDETFNISLLIGADKYWEIVGNRVVRGNGPTAVQSKIGYLLSGPLPIQSTDSATDYIMNLITSPPDVSDLERFWKLESLGISHEKDEGTTSDYLTTYQMNSIEFKDGHYSAKLPWKREHQPLPDNYNITVRRTENTIRRLRQDPDMLQKYGKIIADQEKRGFVERVVVDYTQNQIHYIPHHAVKKDSATTPIRIVFDCSCRQNKDSPSLNDCLESNPPELNDLTAILMRFRLHRFAVCTDIEKAFLHVQLDEKDRDVTRFLWLSDSNNPYSSLVTYRFKSVLFGATCSPFILHATLMKHLDKNEHVWVSETLRKDLYVDNVISSFPDEGTVADYFRDTRDLMSSAGFNLRSWNSNSNRLRGLAEAEDVLDSDKVTKILGMRWDPITDQLSVAQKNIPMFDSMTKRSILQETAKLYDPLGVFSPLTVRAKILLQDIWKQKYDWDVPLPEDIQIQWYHLAEDLNCSIVTRFPRYYFNEADDTSTSGIAEDVSLHVFCDASLHAYGSVVYISRGKKSTFVMARSRVAPLKQLTLPKLELMAAVIGARLLTHILHSIPAKKVYMWSDSQIILHWLVSKRKLTTFVQNRVAEIQELTENRKWRYCPTHQNPADLLTRGISAIEFQNNKLWLNGPEWLTDQSMWPSWQVDENAVLLTTIDEQGNDRNSSPFNPTQSLYGIHNVIDINKFSRYKTLLRVTAYVKRFINRCKSRHRSMRKCPSKLEPLTVLELQEASRMWLHSCQSTYYEAEITNLKSNEKRLTLVKQLRLFLDEDGYIRCGGRIHNAPLTELTKFPYLLPNKHPLTRLIVLDARETQLHAGTNALITHLRQRYWIPALRQYVQSLLRKCTQCRKVIGRPYAAPDPPPLPKMRVQDAPPFTVTGVDFTGALYVRNRKDAEKKAYICLFTCASTRAVHLEVVPDLSEESFIQAFRRFTCRNSLPRILVSDNATTFNAAANSIQLLLRSATIQDTFHSQGTEWRFIPKRAPWFGGWWERMIGLMKTTIKKVLGRAFVSYESLRKIVTEIEGVMNDRPLTYVTTDAADPDPLTPAHLLYGRRITSLPHLEEVPAPKPSTQTDISKRARILKQLIGNFRERWRHEYLTSLRQYHQTTGNNTQTIKVGDVVQIYDDSPRTHWKLGTIEQLITETTVLHVRRRYA